MSDSKEAVLSESIQKEIDAWLLKYPPEQKQSVVVPGLLILQRHRQGWLDRSAMDALADYLELPRISVYEVATFYDLYQLTPVGRYKISICTNVSCLLMDCQAIVACVKKRLGIGFGETTPDKLFTLKEVECLAACSNAPVCQINDTHYHENLTPEKMLSLIDQLTEESKRHVS